jgi:hypothetical protein
MARTRYFIGSSEFLGAAVLNDCEQPTLFVLLRGLCVLYHCTYDIEVSGNARIGGTLPIQFQPGQLNLESEILMRLRTNTLWIRSGALTGLLLCAAFLQPAALLAEPVAVRHMEGTVHGFLVLRTAEGKALAAGDLTQVVQGGRLLSKLTFHFKDGSVDDETTVFSQRRVFQLLSDHHVQKGPSFPHPMDVLIDAATGQVTVRSTDGGKEKVETEHLDLPPDLANGLLLNLLKNLPTDAAETKVSYVAATPKPRLVKLAISPQGEEIFSVAGARHGAMRYDVKVKLGGLTGVVAPLIGKQPGDIHVWILAGQAPAFVRMEGQFYEGGPVWTIELTSPVWPHSGK